MNLIYVITREESPYWKYVCDAMLRGQGKDTELYTGAQQECVCTCESVKQFILVLFIIVFILTWGYAYRGFF